MKVFADLNVSRKFQAYNQIGIPDGYNVFATRGYNDRLEYLKEEIAIAKKISGKQSWVIANAAVKNKSKWLLRGDELDFIFTGH